MIVITFISIMFVYNIILLITCRPQYHNFVMYVKILVSWGRNYVEIVGAE